ncbi:exportin-7 [Galendromus occidentalis]|uniref:Exportin-7 n=1 Tax=Galendromus occidentalis TaxID=34638 RepID=A0AAJ7SD48_9ACAR|nr:exportin-7 [Galendromus occidentalis]
MAMDSSEIEQLEQLCSQLYDPAADPNQRQLAEKRLVQFSHSPDCLNNCRMLLERGSTPYSQVLAVTTLTKLVSRTPNQLSVQDRLDVREYILQYLCTRQNLAPFVVQGMLQLFARITKNGWLEEEKDNSYPFRKVTDQLRRFIQVSREDCLVGVRTVQLLAQLVSEINHISEAEAHRSLTKQRKIASSFRDNQLYDIFCMACELLDKGLALLKTNPQDENVTIPMHHVLRLAFNCLTFDFIGTSPDESSDDLCTVQIPTGWRLIFLENIPGTSRSTVQLFFELYQHMASNGGLALSCAVQIASVRRSLFNNMERAKFLNQLVQGVRKILENPRGLEEQSCCHEFCRLLARLKCNYQLGELVKVDNYAETIQLISDFTVTCIQMPQFGTNTLHYLLSLWQRMVASISYVKATEPHLLEIHSPRIVHAYVSSRLEIANKVVLQSMDDPLDDIGMVQQQLDQFSVICRCKYDKTCQLLVQIFDTTISNCQSGTQDKAVAEAQLAWLVYIIGAAVGGRISFCSTEEQDEMDGQMVCRVLQLMNLNLQQNSSNGGLPVASEKLELAMLSFFEQFRKIYVGDQVPKTSSVYVALSEVLGLADDSSVLAVFVRKIITNLKCWSTSELVTNKTLHLLSELSVGYSSVRKLVKLEEVQFILNNHSAEHFPFLGYPSGITDTRCRTTFYTSLGRMLLIDLGEDEERFDHFMVPLTSTIENVGRILLSNEQIPMFNTEDTKKCLVGLARDLRGLSLAFNTKTSYMMLFEWIFPKYIPVLHRAIEIWYHDPVVTTPVLKLMAELVQNRSQRLQFDVSSPNGILLFRETSKMMVTYGTRLLSIGEVPKDQLYSMKLKGVSICLSMLKAALCGSYVNFGVFKLYGDSALDDALNTFIKMLTSIPQESLLSYPKLSQTYYVLLECLTQDHMNFIAKLEPSVFLYIMSSVSDGLTALEAMVCTGCCAILDHIVTYVFKFLNKSKAANPTDGATCVQVLERHPEILQQMLATLLNIVMFEDCRNQWSMSRPLLGLILLNPDYFRQLTISLVEAQPPEKRTGMMSWFQALMLDIDRNLLTKNRDKFTMNLSVFRKEINESLKGQSCGTHTFNEMMS